jgi:hypothetical protein
MEPVNPIVQFENPEGFQIWGQQQTRDKPTKMDRVGLRRLCFYIEKTVRNTVRNTKHLEIEPAINAFMKDVQERQGVDSFRVECQDLPDEFNFQIILVPHLGQNEINIDFKVNKHSYTWKLLNG